MNSRPIAKSLVYCGLLLAAILAVLFFRSFDPSQVVFSNDGPLGAMVAQQNRMPAIMTGLWQDLNWLGSEAPTPSPTLSSALRLVTSPLGYSKIFCPFSLFFLGICAFWAVRQFGLDNRAACGAALATALSSHFLSAACWGVAAQVIAVGWVFLAVGLIAGGTGYVRWVRLALAGLCLGMNIMEAYDIGAIFSLFVAAYIVYQAWAESDEPAAKRLGKGVLRTGVVALLAAFVAAHALAVLVGTQIKGVAGVDPAAQQSKAERWDWATQWSFPPDESLRFVIPGLYGYRMDTPKDMAFGGTGFGAGAYWGRAGETPGWTENHNDPEWRQAHPNAWPRFSGGGEYAGVLVVVVAFWAVLQSWRKRDSVFTLAQRRWIWFWTGAAVLSLLLSYGRYAPFYQFFYMLPYFSTIRNPVKFLHTLHWALVILFAYGVHGLSVKYLAGSAGAVRADAIEHLKQWWAKVRGFDRTWVMGSITAFGVSLLGWLLYAASRAQLEKRIADAGFGEGNTPELMAGFSIREVGLFALCLLLTVVLLSLVISGWFVGARARWATALLGLFLMADLGRAALPWIIYQNYQQKLASNPVIDFLAQKPYEQRVAILPFNAPQQLGLLSQMYRIEWAQHHFMYYNIQSLDVVQMPRPPVDMVAFEGALSFDGSPQSRHRIIRRWELTNTRYLLGAAGFLDVLNGQLDPEKKRFSIKMNFNVVPKPGIANPVNFEDLTAVPDTNGPFAIFEFSGALPRASLFGRWQVMTNDQTMLETLGSPSFDPHQVVLVADGAVPASVQGTNTAVKAGEVSFASYAPKRIVLKARAEVSSVLLLNDRYAAGWRVTVDGQPSALLRCNYLMRGVSVPAGEHEVVFSFERSNTGLYVSLAAVALGLALLGVLAVENRKTQAAPEPKT